MTVARPAIIVARLITDILVGFVQFSLQARTLTLCQLTVGPETALHAFDRLLLMPKILRFLPRDRTAAKAVLDGHALPFLPLIDGIQAPPDATPVIPAMSLVVAYPIPRVPDASMPFVCLACSGQHREASQ